MGARMPDEKSLRDLGFRKPSCLYYERDSFIKNLRIMDEQEFINRFKWYNLPKGFDGELIERMLYYRGSVALFYVRELDTFYILPYALEGGIDFVGRYLGIKPMPFNGKAELTEEDKKREFIPGLNRKPVYEIVMPDELTIDTLEDGCVLLNDYCKQMSQQVLPRYTLSDIYIQHEADYMCYMHTALMNSTGISGMKVSSADEEANVTAASMTANKAALTGEKWIAIKAGLEFQELTKGTSVKAEEFLLAAQSIDNQRLATMGIENGGIFQKKAHELQTEADMIVGKSNSVMEDSLRNRQRFCDIVNSIWGIGIWVEPSETAVEADLNGDSVIGDDREPGQEQEGGTSDDTVDDAG